MNGLETDLRALVFDQGMAPAEAVDALYNTVALSQPLTDFFLRRGMIDWVNNQLSAGRRSTNGSGWADTSVKRNGRLQAKGLSAPEIQALLIFHEGADGKERALWEFSVADWLAHYDRCKTQVHGWQGRAALDRDVLKALRGAGVPTIAGLPLEEQREFARRIEEAWNGS